MNLRNLETFNVEGKTVLYRAPYDIDVRQTPEGLKLSDDMRIVATLPTLKFLLEKKCKIVVLTYVGRPDGKVVDILRTTPHAKRLAELLGTPVDYVDDCIGDSVKEKISNMKEGNILMLENVRFHPEEMQDDDNFAKELCVGMDVVVFDGFPQAHRKHSSTTGILRHLPSCAGMYLESEVKTLSKLLEAPKLPFTVIIGGAKISDKVDVIFNLLNIADTILVGGAVANVFLKAQGSTMGDSFIEDVFVDKGKREKRDWVQEAKDILEKAKLLEKKIVTPVDLMVSDGKASKIVDIATQSIPSGSAALDIGPRTQANFSEIIKSSQTIFINGPMGKFEDSDFTTGSLSVLRSMREVKDNSNADVVVGGGDTIDLVRKYSKLEDYSHVSLAGGATLEFLAGKELPALALLMK